MSNGDKSTYLSGIGWKILPWLADLVCAFLTYFAWQMNVAIAEIRSDLRDANHEIVALNLWRAETQGNRYTAKDHTTYAEAVQREFITVSDRIAALQREWLANLADVKVTLARLESKLEPAK